MNLLLRQIPKPDISLTALVPILGIAAFAYLVLYLLLSDALFFMAKRKGTAYPLIAWFPFIRLYLAGSLIDETVELFELKLPYAHVILPVFSVLSRVFSLIPVFGAVLSVIFRLYQSLVFHRLFGLCGYHHPLIPAVIVFLVPPLSGVFVFAKRKHFGASQPRKAGNPS